MTTKKEEKHFCMNCKKEIPKRTMISKGKGKSRIEYCQECGYDLIPDWADWCNLFEYIKRLYNVTQPSSQIITQLNKYKKDNNFTDYGMLATLKYVYEILELELDEEKGVGIIPYYYDKAKKFINKKYDIEDKTEKYNIKTSLQVVKTKRHDNYNCKKINISLDKWKEQEG